MTSDFRMGPWLVQPSLNTVSSNGTSVRLEPKLMQVLVYLAQQSGEPVPKEKLLRAIWQDTYVTDDVLTRSIFELRRVFGDDARDSKFIQTIPKRGYRLLVPVEPASRTGFTDSETGEVRHRGSSRRKWWAAIAYGCFVLLFVGAVLTFLPARLRKSREQKSEAAQIRSIAVLPFRNLSDDSAQEYFAYGMAEELITDLSQLQALKVVSHTSVLQYAGTNKTLPQIARELGVDAVIEGAVQRSANRVRITAQLIYAPRDINLWARTYDRDLNDVLALQSTVASEIADEIRINVTASETVRLKKPKAVNPEALQAYWKGQYYLSLLTESLSSTKIQENTDLQRKYRQAVAYFEETTRLDPIYAPAYLAYADSFEVLHAWMDPSPSAAVLSKERTALMKAIAIDDTLVNAHLSMGNFFFHNDWNWMEAENQYRRALELNPNSAEGHCDYAGFLNSMGRFDEGLREQQVQLQLNPDLQCEEFSPLLPLESHIQRERRYIETHHAIWENYWDLGLLLWKAGEYKDAVNVWQEWMRQMGYTEVAQALGRGYTRAGFAGAMREWAKAGEFAAQDRYVPRCMMSYIYGVLGDNDRAFFWLERAYAEHESSLQSLKFFWAWDPIRSDPRFKQMIRRVGLPP